VSELYIYQTARCNY